MNIKSRIFREVVSNPLYKNDLLISTEYLDPLMGINSIELAVKESAQGIRVDVKEFTSGKHVARKTAQMISEQVGIGSDPNGMWTPYQWLHLMFDGLNIKGGSTVVDIGAGIGRLGIYLREFRPDLRYVGLELISSRVNAARSAGLDVRLHDVSNWLPEAEVYYYYNALPHGPYEAMLEQLKEFEHDFLLISARDPYEGLGQVLSPVKEVPISYPLDHRFIIYSSKPKEVKNA